MRRSIVGLCFHPYDQNHLCVLQEAGNIHMVRHVSGELSHPNVAEARTNSSWACDPYKLRMLVVGDNGEGRLYDISMGGKEEASRAPSSGEEDDDELSDYDSDFAPFTYFDNVEKKYEKKSKDSVAGGKNKKGDKK